MKLYSQPNPLFSQSSNPLSFLGPVLFPPGTSNAPVDQLQHFFGAGFAPVKKAENQPLVSLEATRSHPEAVGLDVERGLFKLECCENIQCDQSNYHYPVHA